MSKTILLTGATGAVGSVLLPRLLGQGLRVLCLIRAKDTALARERIVQIVGRNAGVEAICGDVRAHLCGVTEADLNLYRGSVASVLHCAANINFSDESGTNATNVVGVSNLLNLANELDISDFRHVSTAYVAGDAERFTECDFDLGQSFRNAYERSKFMGEALVRRWAKPGRSFTIFRPSILIGCEDGSTPTFDAFYTWLKPFATAAAKTRERRARGLPEGIHIARCGTVTLPLLIQISPNATLNLVPIDWAADAIVELLKKPSSNSTFHLVHPSPPRIGWTLETSLRLLKIKGVEISETEEKKLPDENRSLVAKLQRNVDHVIAHYLPYTNGEPAFGFEQTTAALGPRFRAPRPINELFLSRLLHYAESMNWTVERRLSPSTAASSEMAK